MIRSGILRLAAVFIICLTVILYNFNNLLKTEITELENPVFQGEKETVLLPEKSEETETESTVSKAETVTSKLEETSSQNSNQTSVEASAQAIKGKIISKYISPYNTSPNYSKVYLKNNAGLKLDLKNLLEGNLKLKLKNSSSPQVLIMHTHTTESYMEEEKEYYTENFNSRNTDNSKNMVKIGSIIAEKLNSAGIKTLHDKTQHDNPQYSGSYSRAAKTIKGYLEKYPDIKIVLDIHRDSVTSDNGDKTKLVTEINGKKAAQVMLVMGSQSGSITDYPNWQENLKLAVKLQQKLETDHPTLARPILLMSKKYNQNLTTGSLLLEFGTDVNTLSEACYSAQLVGDSLAKLLNNLKE